MKLLETFDSLLGSWRGVFSQQRAFLNERAASHSDSSRVYECI